MTPALGSSIAILVTLAGPLAAQQAVEQPAPPPPTGLVVGTVMDPAGRPIPDAEVFILSSGSVRRTDASGRFALRLPAGLGALLRVRKIGYAPAQFSVTLAPGERRDYGFRLDAYTARELPDIDVVARSGFTDGPAIREMAARLRRGESKLLSRDDLERFLDWGAAFEFRLRGFLPYTPRSGLILDPVVQPHPFPQRLDPFRRPAPVSTAVTQTDCWMVSLRGDFAMQGARLEEFSPAQMEAVELIPMGAATTAIAGVQHDGCGVAVLWPREVSR
ncbi:MAG: carboxypeptidase-like regulatory domain-containing protein [Gemmatimonadales bacterium]|nr:carboxypeptidase-like regulatory domain-containing protein [Gemmatimonadales bacterium]